MVSAYFHNSSIESPNYMKLTHNQQVAIDEFELNDMNSLFMTNELTIPEQQFFLSIVRQADLQEHYDLSRTVKYFEMEGLLQ